MSDKQKYAAKWGPKGFLVTPEKVVPFLGLSTEHSLKSEYHEDTSGPEPINVRGREPQTITFSTRYLTAAGTYPKNQMRQWYDLIGKTYPMYIAGKQFGPPLLQLFKVDCDKFLYAPNGQIIGVDIHITLQEYSGEKKEITPKTFDAWVEADKKRAAMYSKPSKDEKKRISEAQNESKK